MMHADEVELWNRYETTRDDTARNAIAERYLPLVDRIAAAMCKRVSRVSGEEMRSAGCRGLLDAIRTFDRSRGLRPATHFQNRIRGEMLDAMREADPLPRLLRIKVKTAHAVAERLGRQPSPDELAAELGVERLTAVGVLEAINRRRDPYLDQVADQSANRPSIRIETAYARRYLLRGLNQTERFVMTGYYFEGRTMKQVGADIGLSESRVSQMVKGILSRLRTCRNYETEREAI